LNFDTHPRGWALVELGSVFGAILQDGRSGLLQKHHRGVKNWPLLRLGDGELKKAWGKK
jgi:hypothetical protein